MVSQIEDLLAFNDFANLYVPIFLLVDIALEDGFTEDRTVFISGYYLFI